jgi:hypothetical protein
MAAPAQADISVDYCNADNLYMPYFFYAADGTIIAYPDFRCYRDAGGTYHDVNLHYNVVG